MGKKQKNTLDLILDFYCWEVCEKVDYTFSFQVTIYSFCLLSIHGKHFNQIDP